MEPYLLKIGLVALSIFFYFWKKDKQREAKELQSFYFDSDPNSIIRILPAENRLELKEEFRNQQLNPDKVLKSYLNGARFKLPIVSHPILEREIPKGELTEVLRQANLPVQYDCSTGSRPGEIMLKNTYGYGWSGQGICFSYTKDYQISEIWMTGDLISFYLIVKPILLEMGKQWNLVLADRKQGKIINLTNLEALDECYYRGEEDELWNSVSQNV